MENNTENKQKFFAQYYGQNVAVVPDYKDGETLIKSHVKRIEEIKYLDLKNLKNITDYDSIALAKIIEDDDDDGLIYKVMPEKYNNLHYTIKSILVQTESAHPMQEGFFSLSLIQIDTEFGDVIVTRYSDESNEQNECPMDNDIFVYDFLRSKGYLIPYNGLSIEGILQNAWAFIDK